MILKSMVRWLLHSITLYTIYIYTYVSVCVVCVCACVCELERFIKYVVIECRRHRTADFRSWGRRSDLCGAKLFTMRSPFYLPPASIQSLSLNLPFFLLIHLSSILQWVLLTRHPWCTNYYERVIITSLIKTDWNANKQNDKQMDTD